MYCISDLVGKDCNDCTECKGLLCSDCPFYNHKEGCSLDSKCHFKYSDASEYGIKEAIQIRGYY